MVHEKLEQRNSWVIHAQPGWFSGPAMDDYRYYTVHMTKTRRLRFTDTLSWFSSKVVIHILTSTDRNIATANDLTTALLNPLSVAPFASIDNTTQYYLKILNRLLGNHIIKGTYTRLLKPISRV